MCLRVYGATISKADAQKVALAHLTCQQKLSNPLLDSLLYFLNNPQKSI
jgi:hypothetical protein